MREVKVSTLNGFLHYYLATYLLSGGTPDQFKNLDLTLIIDCYLSPAKWVGGIGILSNSLMSCAIRPFIFSGRISPPWLIHDGRGFAFLYCWRL